MSEVAIITTSEGEMVVEFWPDVAPGHVKNFQELARKGFYDGTCFHRVIKGFMIQGGDPLTKDEANRARWGTGGPGHQVKAEFNNKPHIRGVLSMARSSDPNSAGSQFFICHEPAPSLDGKYTAFGKLIKGDDVLEKIATTQTGPARYAGQAHEHREHQDRPGRQRPVGTTAVTFPARRRFAASAPFSQ
jgi:peptidyl-prolyl cis-trans isomerase B (cyclophilin B)